MHFATFSHIHILSPAFSHIKHDIIIKQFNILFAFQPDYEQQAMEESRFRWAPFFNCARRKKPKIWS